MTMESIFFGGWQGLLRTLLVGVLAYASLVLILRISGKRTLSKMNAFDFVVTVALGSTLATILLSKDVALAEGVLALALLIGLQWLVAWSSARSALVTRLVKSKPTLLAYQGRLLEEVMVEERVIEECVASQPFETKGWLASTPSKRSCSRRTAPSRCSLGPKDRPLR